MTYSAGIIGTGGAAGMGLFGVHDESEIGEARVTGSHAGGYAAVEDLELTAIADIDTEALETFGETWNISAESRYPDHQSMLKAENLDVVSVCTPSFLHRQHVTDAATSIANPDVIWCEKPIASSVADATEMIGTCREEDVDLVVNHSFRFTEKVRRLRELIIEDQLIGDLHSVTLQFRMELLRNATHVLDLMAYFLDERASTVSGYINGENEAAESLDAAAQVDDAGGGGHLVLNDGTFVTVDCTVPRNSSSMALTLIGRDGKLYLNNDDGEWRYWALENGDHVERPLPGIEEGWTWETDYEAAFPAAAQHLVELLEGNTENRSSGQEAQRSLEIIIGIFISHYTDSHVDIPLSGPLTDVEISSW
jgi:predicted dehydrogenase